LTGYIILAVFIGLVVSHTAVFFTGYSRARKKAGLERIEDENRRLQSDREFQKEKVDIKKEVYGNAADKKRLLLLPALLAVIALMLSTTACASTPRIEYVYDVPAVTFPVFPPPDCTIYDEATDTVSIPLWYWQKIAEYKIDVDAIEEYLNRLRAAVQPEGKQ
jgi:hypothetical protein